VRKLRRTLGFGTRRRNHRGIMTIFEDSAQILVRCRAVEVLSRECCLSGLGASSSSELKGLQR
jgi:hypothetical protein